MCVHKAFRPKILLFINSHNTLYSLVHVYHNIKELYMSKRTHEER